MSRKELNDSYSRDCDRQIKMIKQTDKFDTLMNKVLTYTILIISIIYASMAIFLMKC